IRDENNCIVSLGSHVVSELTILSATVTPLNADCNGASTGAINITGAAGGTGDYEYSIGGAYQASASFTGLAAGTYAVSIRDDNNCIVSLGSHVVSEPSILSATVTPLNADCNGASTGAINITGAAGGTGDFEYSIGGAYQTTASFAGLAAGTYAVSIRDDNNCIVSLGSHVVSEPSILSATVTPLNADCN